MNKEYQYDVALSFAGEERVYVEEVAKFLRLKGVRVFYDQFDEVTSWGKNLTEHFDDIYQNQALYCVMFISRHYAQKAWPKYEKQSALVRALGDQGYILPVRFDTTSIPGLQPTIGYIDLGDKTPQQLGELIIKKLGKPVTPIIDEVQRSSFRRPKVAKSFDPYKESQAWIDYLIKNLEKLSNEADLSFSRFAREGKECLRFVANGKVVYSMNVQLGGFHRDHGLTFSYAPGEMSAIHSGINAFADLEWDKERECVVLKLSDFSAYSQPSNERTGLTQQEFLERMWNKVCDAIEERH